MSQVRGLPLETEAASSPELGLQEGQIGGLQACAPVLPLNRSMTTYLTRRWCRTGREVQGAPHPPTPTARSPIRHWLCPHPIHTTLAPATQPGLQDGQLYSAPSPGAGAWLDPGSQDPSSPETKSYQSGGAASLRSSPHVRRDVGEPGKASSWASASCANSPGSSHRTLSAESPETAQPGHLQPT